MSAPTANALRSDLKLINTAIDRLPDPATKRVLKELTELKLGLVDTLAAHEQRLEEAEGAIDDLLNGQNEGMSAESAQVFVIALEQSKIINGTFRELIESIKNPYDGETGEKILAVLKNSDQQIATAQQLALDLVFDESTDEDDAEDDDEDAEDDDEDAEIIGGNGVKS